MAKVKFEKPTVPPDPNVTTDADPPTEVTSQAPMETTLTPKAAVKNPAEDNPEEAKEEAADEPIETFTKPMVEDKPATDTPPLPVATEASQHRPAFKDVVTTHLVIPEQNRKPTKNNQAAQVQETNSKVGDPLTDDDDAFTERVSPFNPDPGPRTDPPDMTSSRQKFVEPMDIFTAMTTMAWDKIHIFADMTSNKMIQGVQPFRMRKPDENERPWA